MNYNRIVLVGRLTRDPEVKATASGMQITNFSIAVNRPQSAEARRSGQQSEADFFDIVTFQDLADRAANFLLKGKLVLVEGRVQIRSYQSQDGQSRKAFEVIASNFQLMEKRQEGEGGYEGEDGGGYNQGGGGGYSQQGGGNRGGYNQGNQGGGGGGYDRQDRAPAASGGSRGGYGGGQQGGGRGRAPQPQNNDVSDDFDDPFANE